MRASGVGPGRFITLLVVCVGGGLLAEPPKAAAGIVCGASATGAGPTGGGGSQHGFPDPTNGATGSNVFGINLAGNENIL